MNDNIESICVIPSDNFDEMWMVVDRANGRMIERFELRDKYTNVAGVETLLPETLVFTDSSITFANTSAGYISGLTHLASSVVEVLADGVVLATQLVSASGSINLSSAYDLIGVGLPYSSDLCTLNIEVPLPDGSIQGRKVKISNVTFRLINTGEGAWVGPDEDTLYNAFSTQNLSSAVENDPAVGSGNARLFNCDLRIALGAGYEQGGQVFLRQKKPKPITIGALIPEVSIPNPTIK